MKQYALNIALWADLTLNTVLGGYPRETVSARLGRARAKGSAPACAMCSALSWVSKTLLRDTRDHCTWALDETASIGREVWRWGPR